VTLGDRLRRVIRQQARRAGREYAESKRAYREAREAAERVDPREFNLPSDSDGNARIVCRRPDTRNAGPSPSTPAAARPVSRPVSTTVRGVPRTSATGGSKPTRRPF